MPLDPPLHLGFAESATAYDSPSQNARLWTEAWVHAYLFCPNCGASGIDRFANNRAVADFHCAACAEEYELKSQKGRFGPRVVDGAFATLCERLALANNPSARPGPRAWRSTLFLKDTAGDARGWLIEVMKCVERIGREDFTLDDVYAHEGRLRGLYPNNHNVRPKIRQQLQVLRDQRFLEFVGRGRYRRTAATGA